MKKIEKVTYPPKGWVAFNEAQQSTDMDIHPLKDWYYITDPVKHAVKDYWEIDAKQVWENRAGDCEEYMIACRYDLLLRGCPPEALHFAMCFTETRQSHAVLLVKKDDWWALDVRQDEPKKVSDLPYKGWVVQFGEDWWSMG